MQKIFFTLIVFLCLFRETPVLAQPSGIVEKARDFLLQKWDKPSIAKAKASYKGDSDLCTVDTVDCLALVNVRQGLLQGFVVYSATNRIVGYSTSQNARTEEKSFTDADYELYFRVTPTAATTRGNAAAAPTFATKPDGDVAHFRLASNSAVDQANANSTPRIVVNGRILRMSYEPPFSVFSASGICIAGNVSHYSCPTAGMYIVKTATGFVKVNVK